METLDILKMDSIVFILLVLLGFVLILGVPIGLSYLIYRFIKRRAYPKEVRTLALVPIIVLGYFIYIAIYPSDSFYERDFLEVTGLEFPENGHIKYKTTSFPDNFGDYTSISVSRVDSSFYKNLPQELIKQGFTQETLQTGSREFRQAEKRLGTLNIQKSFSFEEDGGVYYFVAFIDDGHSLIVQRSSW